MDILRNKIDSFRNIQFDFYSAEIYKNHKNDTILLVFTTTNFYLVDLGRREIKAVLNYKDIKNVQLEAQDKLRIVFNKEMNNVSLIYLF